MRRNLGDQTNAVFGEEEVDALEVVNPLARDKRLGDLVESWRQENAKLIRSIPEQHVARAIEKLRTGFDEGLSYKEIAENIQQSTGITERRAMTIARTEVGKLHGQLTRERQMNIGLRRYFWRDSNDARVRERHKHFDNDEPRSWDESPIPGEEVNCRCTAEPDFTSREDGLNLFAEEGGSTGSWRRWMRRTLRIQRYRRPDGSPAQPTCLRGLQVF